MNKIDDVQDEPTDSAHSKQGAHLQSNAKPEKVDALAPYRQVAPWDDSEAARLIAALRAEVVQIETDFGGELPHPLWMLLADAVWIGERFIREHEAEAARGWNALELLRDLVPMVRECVENYHQCEAARRTLAPAPPALTGTKERQGNLFQDWEVQPDAALAD